MFNRFCELTNEDFGILSRLACRSTISLDFAHRREQVAFDLDARDAETMSTIEENNDTLDQGQRAMARRAFIGLDHSVWDYEPREPLCELYHNG